MTLRRVRKRDGREEAFDKGRIRAAVAAAQTAVGEEDPTFASEVADLVEFALRRRYAMDGEGPGGESGPDVEEIQDLVELALIQLGRAAVAKAYILYRDRRARAREAQGAGAPSAPPGALKGLRVRDSEGSSSWSKGRIIAALVDEAQLSRKHAEEVAQRVEQRVVSSGLKRISTALVRELVDNELVAMGLAHALARHEPVALPRHDLRRLLELGPPAEVSAAAPRWLSGRRLGEQSVEGVAAGEILRRFAEADLLSEASLERCTAGELFVEDLRRPHLHLVQSVPCELFSSGEPSARSAFELLGELALASASVSRGLVLEAPAAVLSPLVRAGRADLGLSAWLLALRAQALSSGKRIDLARPGLRAPAVLARLVEELAALAEQDAQGEGPLPRLFLDREELHSLLEARAPARAQRPVEGARAAVDRLLSAGLIVPSWSRPDELYVGPGLRRRGREQGALACGGAVALNLARAARRAGPWREDLLLQELARLVEAGVEALSELARFQRLARASRAGEARGRVAYAITPVGLREALRILGDGELRPAQGARILGLLAEAARRFAAGRGLSVVLTPFFGRRAAQRFARAEALQGRVSQRLLFDRTGEESERLESLSSGYELGGTAERLEAGAPGASSAELLSTVPTGAWIWPRRDFEPERAGAALEAWECFDRLREEWRAGAAAVGAPPAPRPSHTPALFPSERDDESAGNP